MKIIAPWISSKSYITSSNTGLTIISNQLTHKIILLRDESSVIWSWIEQNTFTKDNCIAYLEKAGSDNPIADIENFLNEMYEQQYLANPNETNYRSPMATPAPQDGSLISSISPVANEEDKALEDEAAVFAEENGFLFSAFWEVTNRCNEKCVHCFNPGAAHSENEKVNRDTEELTTEEGLRLIESFRKAGAYRLVLSGGEILLRRDIFELIAHARRLHMQIHIFTNGILLDDQRLEKLSRLYPESVSISLYSANAAIHDQITRVPGSLEKSILALRKLHSLGIKTTVKAIQMQHTIQGYKNIEELAYSLGARTTVELNMSAGNDGAQGPLSLAVADDNELIALAVTKGSPIFVGDSSNNFGERLRGSNETFCSAGLSVMSVSSDGKVYPCVALPLEIGTLNDNSFDKLWERSLVGQRTKGDSVFQAGDREDALSKWQSVRIADYVECGTHDRCSWCNKCPGMSLNETGNALSASLVQCRIASARMRGANMLRDGKTPKQIWEILGIASNFGSDNTVRSFPEIPIKFISKESWEKTLITKK